MLFHVSRHLFMIQLGISVLATCRPHVTTYSKFWSLPRHDTLTLRPSQCGNRSKLLKPFQRMFSVGFAKGKLLLGPKRIQWKTNPVTFFATFASEKVIISCFVKLWEICSKMSFHLGVAIFAAVLGMFQVCKSSILARVRADKLFCYRQAFTGLCVS